MHAALALSGAVVAEGLPGPAFARHMLAVDPPHLTRLRRLASARVHPERVDALEPRIQSIVDDMLDAIEARGADTGGSGREVRVPVAVHGDLRAARELGVVERGVGARAQQGHVAGGCGRPHPRRRTVAPRASSASARPTSCSSALEQRFVDTAEPARPHARLRRRPGRRQGARPQPPRPRRSAASASSAATGGWSPARQARGRRTGSRPTTCRRA